MIFTSDLKKIILLMVQIVNIYILNLGTKINTLCCYDE